MNRSDIMRLAQLAHQLEKQGLSEEADQIDQAITGLDSPKSQNEDTEGEAASRLVEMVLKELHVNEGFPKEALKTPEGQARVLEALYEEIMSLNNSGDPKKS